MANILVASKDETLRNLLDVSLRRFEHFLRLADTGEDSLDAIQKDTFDLALFDIELPDMTARDILLRMKQTRQSIPICMIMCEEVSAEIIQEHSEAGANDFVVKPFNLPNLIMRIESLLKSKHLA